MGLEQSIHDPSEKSRSHIIYVVASIESGGDIKTVQGNLGHAIASLTLDFYGHIPQKMWQQSADQFIQSVSSSYIQAIPHKAGGRAKDMI